MYLSRHIPVLSINIVFVWSVAAGVYCGLHFISSFLIGFVNLASIGISGVPGNQPNVLGISFGWRMRTTLFYWNKLLSQGNMANISRWKWSVTISMYILPVKKESNFMWFLWTPLFCIQVGFILLWNFLSFAHLSERDGNNSYDQMTRCQSSTIQYNILWPKWNITVSIIVPLMVDSYKSTWNAM